MAFRYGNRDQITFLPDCIEHYVTEEDPVRVYDAFVDALDLGTLGISMDDTLVGNSCYDPVTMLKILVYSYSYGWRSSRKIERALHHNLSFIWLAGGLKPDFKTIANFRKNNKESLKNILKQCAQICLKLNLIAGNTLFVDGSKFRANAGRDQSKHIETWERYEKHVEERIEKLLEECQQVDQTEKESLIKLTTELKNKKTLKKKIGQLLEEVKTTQKGIKGKKTDKINITDSECKVMKSRQGSHACYNNQMVVDNENGLIVSMDATNAVNDLNQLNSQIKLAEEILGKSSKIVCADSGYSSVDDLKPILEQGKVVVVPNAKQASKTDLDNPFSKDKFVYDSKSDTYLCPQGKILKKDRNDVTRNKIVYKIPKALTCKTCKHFGTCTKSTRGRSIFRQVNEISKEQLEKIYESKQGQQVYKKRKMLVEHPFGHIKRNLGADCLLLRGFNGANTELSLLATCFNLTRMVNILGGTKSLIGKLRAV